MYLVVSGPPARRTGLRCTYTLCRCPRETGHAPRTIRHVLIAAADPVDLAGVKA